MNAITPIANERIAESQLDVLIIDGDEPSVKACRETLEDEGYLVAVASSGRQGLQLAALDHPSVVLLDLHIPDMTGLETLDQLARDATFTVPIILTRDGSLDSAVESLKLGANDFLIKPFDPEKLLESVHRGLDLSAMRKQASATPDRHDLLLQGLDVLNEAYSMGIGKRQLLDALNSLENEAKDQAKSQGGTHQKDQAILNFSNDLREADDIMREYDFRKNALIQMLLDVQEKFHWLPRHILSWMSGRLGIPLREIYVIANFYEAFSLEPRGRHTFQVCTGTACHVRGSSELLTRVSAALGIAPGQTDSNLTYTLETVHCLGCCALAPVVQIDDEYYRDPERSKIDKMIKKMQKEETHE